jgi:hypothetical protein
MNTPTEIEAIMNDGSTQLAIDVIEQLIASEVTNTIAEVGDDYNLSKHEDIICLSEMIACHLESAIKTNIHPSRVIGEFLRQLQRK